MRKFLAPALVGAGAFLLVVGILAALWAPGAVKKTPLDVNTTTRLSGEAAKIDPSSQEMIPKPIFAENLTRIDPKASTDDIAVWVQQSCVAFGTGGNCYNPKDPNVILLPEDQIVTADDPPSIFGTDRETALAVPVAKLPKTARDAGAMDFKGIINKFPFDTDKKTYPYWDGTVGESVDANFVGTKKIQGVETYHFRVVITQAEVEIADGVPGAYSSTKDLYVEPDTGAIINQTEKQQRWTEDGTQVLDLTIGFTDKQVASNAKDAKSNVSRLDLITKTVPLIGLIGGAILLLAGAFLAARRVGVREGKQTYTNA
ncbi:MAG: DUF3068 domain-containing protein [Nocardioidaceae bacterium]|nr:DUF3068 domain-containing protein [Nocardioidaceae bacterium]